MKFVIPILYTEYGRYITRFRAIPFYIDCLIPAQRRLLLSAYDVARDKFVKSAKVVGYATGTYHPHGDQSVYGTLVKLVYNGFLDKQGNWGSDGLEDAPPAAFRYTECRLSKWVKEIAFKYIDYVPWQNFEYEDEPLYLPSPLPLGLIGHGIYTGIAVHRTQIPRYNISALTKRLISLLNKNEEHPIIIPSALNCSVIDNSSTKDQFNSILKTGIGIISYVPNGTIKNKKIRIQGRAPNSQFNNLINDSDVNEKRKQKILEVTLTDLSRKGIDIEVTPDKRKIDITQLAQHIWEKYLIKSKNIAIITCNEIGNVVECGVDQILLTNYNAWQYAVLQKNIKDCQNLFNKKKEMSVIYIIRQIIQKYNSKKVDDIIHKFNTDYTSSTIQLEKFNTDTDNWDIYNYNITDLDIKEICSKKSIKSLIEIEIDLSSIDSEINNQKNVIGNTPNECYQQLTTYL